MADLDIRTDADGLTRVALDRPERHNALDRALIDRLRATLSRLDRDTRVLLLEGRGKSFCAGADIGWMRASVALSAEENTADAMALSALLETLDTLPCPSVARVHGAAIGGGAGLLACCDVVVASDAARFAFSEVRLGLTPATISPYVLRAIGSRAARRWFLTAERFDATVAYRLGLAHEICADADLDRRVGEIVAALLQGGPAAQTASKRLIGDVAGRPIDEALRGDVARRLAETRAGAEAQEGLAAFLDRRDPSWRVGRAPVKPPTR